MKTTNKKLTIEDVFGFIKKREEFNSDIEYLAYVYTEHLEVAGNAFKANRFFESSEFENLAKTENEKELPKNTFKMIDIYPDFYTKNCNTTTNKNTNNYEAFELLFTDKKREDFNSNEEYEEYKEHEIKYVIEEIVKAMLPMEGDKERFTMIDIYPDFYSSMDKTVNEENKEVIL